MSRKNTEYIEGLITQQEELLAGLKKEIDKIDEDSVIAENEALKERLQKTEQENARLHNDNKALSSQLEAAKASLFAKMANEKLMVFSKTQRELEKIYYTEGLLSESRLKQYKRGCLKNLEQMRERIEAFSNDGYTDLLSKIDSLDNEINCRFEEISRRAQQENQEMLSANNATGNALMNEELTETEKRVALKQKSLESFIGLNVLSKAGILLFIIGIIALGRFAYVHLPDIFKELMIFALGAVLVGVGELFHKKEKSVFSTVLISGGVAVLYAACATGYFALDLFGVEIAFLLCVAVTAAAIGLSAQLKNQVVCAFAAVGGYLPLVATYMIGFGSAAADKSFLPVSAVYFCLLAVIIFAMTRNKRWYAAQYIGYGFQILATVGIARCAWVLKDSAGFGFATAVAAVFAVASFAIYLLMPAVKIIGKKEIELSDTVLMGLNSVSGAVSVGITISNCFAQRADGNKAAGAVFFAIALLYALLVSKLPKTRKSTADSALSAVLYSVIFVLSLSIAPLVFGWKPAAAAWVAEGAIIAIAANGKRKQIFEIIGFVCMIASGVLYAVVFDYYSCEMFCILSLVTFTVMLIAFWLYTHFALSHGGENEPVYLILEAVMAVVTVAYLIYIYRYALQLPFVKYFSEFTDYAVYALILAAASLFIRCGALKNGVTDLTALVFRIAMLVLTFAGVDIYSKYNEITLYYGQTVKVQWITVMNLILLLAVNVLSLVLVSIAVNRLLVHYRLPVWIYTAVISVSAMMLITAVLMGQFNVKFSNVIISALYIAAACILLVIGFKKRYTVVRTGGLVLILAALAKLCFVDTRALDTGWKIGAYFGFGAVLIIISFFYQRFTKKLEQEALASIEGGTENIDE